ncbi:MAG: quinol:cytochrome C oxidoreductase [Planctomycetota bacterium]
MSGAVERDWAPDDAECRLPPAARYGLALGGLILGAGLVGGSWLAASGSTGGAARFWQSYYVAFCFWLTLSLGALFFVLLHHLVRATWSVVVLRVAEIFAANLLLIAVLFVPLAVAAGTDTNFRPFGNWLSVPAGSLPAATVAFLSRDFLLARCALYFVIWAGLALSFWRRSVAQDESGDARLTLRSRYWSGLAMLLYAFSVAFGGLDFLMSLNAPWQSSIYGVYFFSGCAVGFYALLPLAVLALQSQGRLKRAVTAEHYHDMGKMLFAFVFFWSYIAYSQYMLIWYADLPEETVWLMKRAGPEAGAWNYASLVLLFGHWLIPFAALLSRDIKRRKLALGFWCVWLLALHYVDLYWLVFPEWQSQALAPRLSDAGCLVGLGGIYLAGALAFSGGRALLPVKDPQLAESLTLENY